MQLLPFQITASTQIADRFQEYRSDPLLVKINEIVPFYQNLSSITGSGKTLILADTVEQIRSHLPVEPIVLWLSKGKVVVWQTYANLAHGKYAELLGGFKVKPLPECTVDDISDSNQGLVLVATVGKFNQRDKEQGGRKIFRVSLDAADKSLWEQLKHRKDAAGRKRPFLVVYDEGHNLSNQQTELLLELKPDALIAASATLKVPQALSRTIDRLRQDKDWHDSDFVTSVDSSEVVSEGLVKKHILLGGYVTPMEIAVNEMLGDLSQAEAAAQSLGLPLKFKAIYVSSTNTVDGTTIKNDVDRPFEDRKARPILIWRHLVENRKIDPADIAVYCDLQFNKQFPPPSNFNLFSGGDADYDDFIAGNFKHIIFNLSLQEGWDDPACSFAYIDKEMGSVDQIYQVVGRVLRQQGAKHYPPAVLNTAHFYIRADEKGVFEDVLSEVEKKLAVDSPEITLTIRKTTKGGDKPFKQPLKARTVPTVSVYSGNAVKPIREITNETIDFTDNEKSTVGSGSRIQVLKSIGVSDSAEEQWVEVEHSNPVTARWVFVRDIQKWHPKAALLCDLEHPRFDALIEYHSPAAKHIREQAKKVVDAYIEHSIIIQNNQDHPYEIGSVPVDESNFVRFKFAIHEGYSGLNALEREFAEAIDKTKRVWCRNPSQSAYGIPLLDYDKTRTFYPDFLVWADKHVVAIDTKGEHLIDKDAGRKLFHIEKVEDGQELVIRLVTEGKWEMKQGAPHQEKGTSGFTVWSLKQGKLNPIHCENAVAAVNECMRVGVAIV